MKEQDIQKDIMSMLDSHPRVVWAYVTSAGTVRGYGGGRPFNIGFNGLADIIGQLDTGQALAIEVKMPGKKPTPEQHTFLDLVSASGGVSGWADSLEKAMEIIKS